MSDRADRSVKSSFPCGFLTIIFIVLKMTHTVAWPWIWVLAPTWIPLALVAAVLIFFCLLCMAAAAL